MMVLAVVAIILGDREAAGSQARIALVLGNGQYGSLGNLANPPNDAVLMAETLSDVGFDVALLTDADNDAMKRAILQFGRRLRSAGSDAVGLFYFAGHGVQAGGANYLIPSRAELQDEADLEIEAVRADWVLAQMESAGNNLNLVILDACRNNPFRSSFRSVTRGLARMNAPLGSFIAYATAPGEAAADGDGRNSPFTSALAEAIREPGQPIEQVFKRVRIEVIEETGGAQRPWDSSSLILNFYFTPGPGTGADFSAPPMPPARIEAELALSVAETEEVERGLALLGHGLARPDGRLSALDRDAIQAWQKDEGRAPTGYLSYAEVVALRRAVDNPPRDTELPTAASPEMTVDPEPADAGAQASLSPETVEDALNLGRPARREIQRRLTLLGHDTRGVDGIFGPDTRAAIVAWQSGRGIPANGFLDAGQIETLERDTAKAYRQWQADEQERRRAATTRRSGSGTSDEPASTSPRGTGSSGRYIDGNGCLREANGAYVPGFRSDCG